MKYLRRLHCVVFSKKGKSHFYYHMTTLLLSLFDLLKFPKQKWPKKKLWKQIFFQRSFRSPKALALIFRYVLRVCITYRCNLSCRYCYAKGIENNFPEDMSVKDFSNTVIWAKKIGWKSIRFLGGEPTIHPHFTDMLEICRRNNVSVSMSTNNLFSSQVGTKLDKTLISYISVNNIFDSLDMAQKTIFLNNLELFIDKDIPFELSYIISLQDYHWSEILQVAKLYRPNAIRVSIAIPGLTRQVCVSDLTSNFKSISSRIFEFQENCIKLKIPFYIYRPVMPCLFSRDDWQRLKGAFPFICFTRCPLGLKGDYSLALVVNPDLSIFPCTSVFVKGPNIHTFQDRRDISNFYKEKIKQIISEPLMESCKTCKRRDKLISNLEKDINSNLKSYFDEALCQGGCLNFKNNTRSVCHSE